jgi:hypothetical protein
MNVAALINKYVNQTELWQQKNVVNQVVISYTNYMVDETIHQQKKQ